jgi:C4-dicarboxylate-binding protein DctP
MQFPVKKVLVCALVAFGATVAQAQQVVIKFSHVVAQDTPKGKAAEFFAKKAAELTGGKVKVEVYANSALYKDKEEMEALQMGSVQMLAPSLAKFGPLGVKEFEVFDLPFIFDDRDDLHKVTNGPVGEKLLKKLEAGALLAWLIGTMASRSSRPTSRSRAWPTTRA